MNDARTIHEVAKDACDLARRRQQAVLFTYGGIDLKARPGSVPEDVAEIWFWRSQFAKWQQAVGAMLG